MTRVALDRERVARTGLCLLDEVGIQRLSLRAIARRLEVKVSALYWHFESKQALLAEMARLAAADGHAREPAEPRSGQQWDGWLADRVRAERRAMLTYRDGAQLAVAGHSAGWTGTLREATVVLERAGFREFDASQAIRALGDYVLGSVLNAQLGDLRRGGSEREAHFEHGLRLLLDGMRGLLGG